MHAAFIEVLSDLWAFITKKRPVLSPSARACSLTEKDSEKVSSLETQPPVKASYSVESRVGYITQPQVKCLQVAQKKFDTLRGLFKYGEVVNVMQHKDSWSFVETPALQGWVETKYLTDDKNEVFAQFQTDQEYDAHNLETVKLRQYLDDELLGGLLELKLQPSEFVMYQLRKLGVVVAWPLERPRLPGAWQSILKGKRGVSIGFEPKTGSALECDGKKERFLAFVESVTPDDSIIISYVGRREAGVYEKRQFSRIQWQDWKPVFISFT